MTDSSLFTHNTMGTTEPEMGSTDAGEMPHFRTPFPPRSHGTNWEAYFQCQSILSKPKPDDGQVYCDAVFDSWLCWDYAPAGTTAYGRCPHEFMRGFNKDAYAEKQCMEDGQWFRNLKNITWTNYMPCSTHQEGLSVLLVYVSGYALSALLLMASILIFCYFRQLRCTRVILHQHLFISYIITGLLWTVSYTQLMTRIDVTRSNPTWCKVVHVFTQYISLSNYCWMFCEGFFLHTIIVHAFSKEKKLLRICYAIGWGVPVIPTIAYGAVRAMDKKLDRDCWIQSGWPLWIINGPIAASLIINFIFFLNIMRILLSKIRAFNTNEQSQYRRAVKATLIMIPLLGVNNLVLLVRPEMSRVGVLAWKIISAFLVAYQGVSVALIFCFFNGEVMTVLRRKWSQCRHTYDAGSGRMRSTSNTMNMTLDDSSVVPKNGFACIATKPSVKNAQDPTELQLMMNTQKNKDLV